MIITVVDTKGNGVIYRNIDRYLPMTSTVPFWTLWSVDGKECRFLPDHAVKSIHIQEEEGDQLSVSTTNSDAQSAVQT